MNNITQIIPINIPQNMHKKNNSSKIANLSKYHKSLRSQYLLMSVSYKYCCMDAFIPSCPSSLAIFTNLRNKPILDSLNFYKWKLKFMAVLIKL